MKAIVAALVGILFAILKLGTTEPRVNYVFTATALIMAVGAFVIAVLPGRENGQRASDEADRGALGEGETTNE